MTGTGTIVLDLENVTPEDIERMRQIFKAMVLSGAMTVRNGSVTMHFDNEGNLQLIDSHTIRFRRKKT